MPGEFIATFNYRALLALGVCALSCAALPAHAGEAPVDLPGAEIVRPSYDPQLLDPLLPNFSAQVMELPTEADGLGPLRLSPSGKYCLAEQRTTKKQYVLLFDGDGKLIRDLTGDRYMVASGSWGATDQQVILACRETVTSRPVHLRMNPLTGATTPGAVPGLPGWAPGGKDYLLGLTASQPSQEGQPSWFQRYTAGNDPVGRPLSVAEPVWSGDGLWLAFVAPSPQPAENTAQSQTAVNEVRVLPARGDVPRVVLPRYGWEKLARINGWTSASGPEQLAWAPAGDALFGMFSVRTEAGDQKCLVRMDVRSPRRDVLPLPADSELVSASADARHWIVRLGDRLFRLDFEQQPLAPKQPAPTRRAPSAS